jgi:insulysin
VKALAKGEDLSQFIYNLKAYGEFDKETLESIVEQVKLENCHIYLISKDFENEVDQEEYYFKTKYAISDIPASLIKAFNNGDLSWATSSATIALPPKNTLIPTDFNILQGEALEVTQIEENEQSSLWHQLDTKFKLPKIAGSVQIYNKNDDSDASYLDAKMVMTRDMWVECFNDFKRGINYLAEMAQCNFSVSSTYECIQISGKCYSQSFGPYTEMLLDCLTRFKNFDNETKFQNIKDLYLKSYKNKLKAAPFRKGFGMIPQIITDRKFSYEELISALEEVSFADFKAFNQSFFKKVRFEWLVEGNIEQENCKTICESFEKNFIELFNSEILSKEDVNHLRVTNIAPGQSFIVEKDIIVPEENNSCYIHLYQIGAGFEKNYARSIFLSAWLRDKYFEDLRTNQQLGYAVFALTRKYRDVYVFHFCVQSDTQSTDHCRLQTLKFIDEWRSKVAEISDEEFEKVKAGCIAKATEEFKNLASKMYTDLSEVMDHSYQFNRKELKKELLEKLTKEELAEFYEKVFYSEKRCLEIHQYAPSKKEEGVSLRNKRLEEDDNLTLCDSNNDFKSRQSFFVDNCSIFP